MALQYAVIGLGSFGIAIAKELTRSGGEVIAVDKELESVERVKDDVAYAVRLDATDPKVIEAHELHRADVVIITIGGDFEAVILIAVEFMQLGAKRIMARAENATQNKILQAVGVTDILTPEEEVAKYVSQRLIRPEMVDLFRLPDGYSIVEVYTPQRLWGKTLVELQLRESFGCSIIAVKRPHEPGDDGETVQDQLLIPMPETDLQEGDTLIVLGLTKDIEALASA